MMIIGDDFDDVEESSEESESSKVNRKYSIGTSNGGQTKW